VTGLHAAGSVLNLVAAGMLLVGAGIAVGLDRGHDAVRRLGAIVVAAFVVQAVGGLVLLFGGGSPREALHLVYAVGLVAVIPLASSFASEAPSRARSGVLAVAGLICLLLAWRLLATG
jgi:hypothetical protein